MESKSPQPSRLLWALSMGTVVVAVAGLLVLVAESRQTTTVEPASGEIVETTPTEPPPSETELKATQLTSTRPPLADTQPPLTPTHPQQENDQTVDTSMPDDPPTDGPTTSSFEIDFDRDCMQVTTIPDCATHAATTSSIATGPGATPDVCNTVQVSTTDPSCGS